MYVLSRATPVVEVRIAVWAIRKGVNSCKLCLQRRCDGAAERGQVLFRTNVHIKHVCIL